MHYVLTYILQRNSHTCVCVYMHIYVYICMYVYIYMYVYHPNSSTGPERCLLCGIRMEAHKIHGAHLSPARTLLRRQVLGGPSLLAQALVQHQRELDLGALLSPEWGHWVRREAGDQGSPVRKLMRLPLDAHVRPRGSPAL